MAQTAKITGQSYANIAISPTTGLMVMLKNADYADKRGYLATNHMPSNRQDVDNQASSMVEAGGEDSMRSVG